MKRLLFVLTVAAALVPAGGAVAQASSGGLNIHAIFEGGRTSAFQVGEPLQVSYRKGAVRSTQVCWTPAPVDRPACSNTFAAAAQAGVQRFVITLSNGRQIRTTRRIRPAATHLPSSLGAATSKQGPVPFTARCSAPLSGTFNMKDPIATVLPGQHVAAYYVASPTLVQVFLYRTGQSGFMKRTCLRRGLS